MSTGSGKQEKHNYYETPQVMYMLLSPLTWVLLQQLLPSNTMTEMPHQKIAFSLSLSLTLTVLGQWKRTLFFAHQSEAGLR